MIQRVLKTPWFDYPQFSWNKKDAIVIGGGIAGCQSAWHLLQTGWKVTLIERHHQLATEASGNKAGAVFPKMTAKPSLGEDFYTQSFRYLLKQLDQLKALGRFPHYDLCGVLQLAHNQREEKRWASLQQRLFDHHFLECLTNDETQQKSGIETPYKSIFFPQGGWIDPASFCRVLVDSAHCNILFNQSILQLKQQQQQWCVRDAKRKVIAKAALVIIANGKDLQQFKHTQYLPMMPVLGQTTEAIASRLSKKLKCIIGHKGYLTPAINECHIFGATFERNKYCVLIDKKSDKINQEQLYQYLPEFSNALGEIQSSHAAIRVTTPDRFPYVGAVINQQQYQQNYADLHQGKYWKTYPVAQYQHGLFVLAGLGSRGLTTSGYCASKLVEIINGKQSNGKIIQSLHLGRFVIKQLKMNHFKKKK